MSKRVVIKEPVVDVSSASDTATTEEELTVIELPEEDAATATALSIENNDGGRADEKESLPRMQQGTCTATSETLRVDPDNIEQKQLQRNCSSTVGWRKQLHHRLELPKLVPQSSRRNKSGDGSNRSRSRSPPTAAHSLRDNTQRESSSFASPNKAPLEAVEQQREFYRSLQKREFVTLHEELQYLRMTHIHTQKTLRLKGEEVTRLQKEVEKKSKEIDRLKALLDLERKRRSSSCGAAAEIDENYVLSGSVPERVASSPSLALFAATAVGGRAHGQPAKLLLELRQNIASRDTFIDKLRMDLESLRQKGKEEADKTQVMAAELKDARTRSENMIAELKTKDVEIRRLRSCVSSRKEVNRSTESLGVNADVGVHQVRFVECEKHYHRSRDGVDSVHPQGDTDSVLPCPFDTGLQSQQQPMPQRYHSQRQKEKSMHEQRDLHRELEHLQWCLDKEKESHAESERQWRRQQEANLRMAEVNLDTAKAEVNAYKTEMMRMQKQVSVATFAESQLEAARNENEAMRLRMHELRQEATALASREKELQNDLRSMKEACNCREEEVTHLQRRLAASRESEGRLREEIDILEGKLARGEKKVQAADRDFPFSSRDLSSYASLMSLNLELHEKIRKLEAEVQETKKSSPYVAPIPTPAETSPTKVTADGAACRVGNETNDHNSAHGGGSDIAAVSERIAHLTFEVSGLKAQLKNVSHDSQRTLLRQRSEAGGELAEIDVDNGDNSDGKALAVETNSVTRKKQWQAYMTGTVGNVQAEVRELHDRLLKYKEELKHAGQELAAAQEEVDTLQQEKSKLEEQVQKVGRRKVSSLLAARKEAAQLQEEVKRLQQQCAEQQRVIATLRMSPFTVTPSSSRAAAAASSSSSFSPPACSKMTWNDEHIIEEALRDESARLDREMDALRFEVHAARRERDHWMALATKQHQK